DLRPGLELENPPGLLGPVVVVAEQVGDEAAGLAEPLGLSETVVSASELLLGAFALVDVDEQVVPADNLAVRITEGQSAGLEPAVDAIVPSSAHFEVEGLPRRDGVREAFDNA